MTYIFDGLKADDRGWSWLYADPPSFYFLDTS